MLKSDDLLKLGAGEKHRPNDNLWLKKFFALDCKYL